MTLVTTHTIRVNDQASPSSDHTRYYTHNQMSHSLGDTCPYTSSHHQMSPSSLVTLVTTHTIRINDQASPSSDHTRYYTHNQMSHSLGDTCPYTSSHHQMSPSSLVTLVTTHTIRVNDQVSSSSDDTRHYHRTTTEDCTTVMLCADARLFHNLHRITLYPLNRLLPQSSPPHTNSHRQVW